MHVTLPQFTVGSYLQRQSSVVVRRALCSSSYMDGSYLHVTPEAFLRSDDDHRIEAPAECEEIGSDHAERALEQAAVEASVDVLVHCVREHAEHKRTMWENSSEFQ